MKHQAPHLQYDVLRQLPVESVIFREPPEKELAECPQRRHGVLHLAREADFQRRKMKRRRQPCAAAPLITALSQPICTKEDMAERSFN